MYILGTCENVDDNSKKRSSTRINKNTNVAIPNRTYQLQHLIKYGMLFLESPNKYHYLKVIKEIKSDGNCGPRSLII